MSLYSTEIFKGFEKKEEGDFSFFLFLITVKQKGNSKK